MLLLLSTPKIPGCISGHGRSIPLAEYAKFKAEGTINDEGAYKFQLWVGDGAADQPIQPVGSGLP